MYYFKKRTFDTLIPHLYFENSINAIEKAEQLKEILKNNNYEFYLEHLQINSLLY